MNFSEAIEYFSLPSNLQEISLSDSRLISYKEYLDKANNETLNQEDYIPIIENALWVGKSLDGGYYSSDGKLVMHTPKGNSVIMLMEKGDKGLMTREFFTPKPDANSRINIFNSMKMEDKNMAEVKKGLNLQDLGLATAELKENKDVEKMDIDGVPSTRAVEMSAPKDTVSELITGNDTLAEIHVFNRTLGRLHCLITKQDHKTQFSVVSVSESKSKSKNGNGRDFAKHGSASNPTDNASKIYQLVMKDAKPSPVIGGIISMPEGGIFTNNELATGLDSSHKPISVNSDKKDLKYALLSKDELLFRVLNAFGRRIRESEDTYGSAAGEVTARIGISKRKKKNSKDVLPIEEEVYVPKFKSPKARALVVESAYFPLKTFKYIEQNANSTQADIDLLNFSGFIHMFKESTKTSRSPHDNLSIEYKRDITKDTSKEVEINGIKVPQITSRYFTLDGQRKDITCNKWMGKNHGVYTNISIPQKKAVQTENKPVNGRIITCDCVKDRDKDFYDQLSSLKDPRFANLVSKFPDLLEYNKLKAVFSQSDKQRQSQRNEDKETIARLADWNSKIMQSLSDSSILELKYQ